MSWFQRAACRGLDTNLFLPEDGTKTNQIRLAKAVCAQCPVTVECLAYAEATNARHGVWGGLWIGRDGLHEERECPQCGKAFRARRSRGICWECKPDPNQTMGGDCKHCGKALRKDHHNPARPRQFCGRDCWDTYRRSKLPDYMECLAWGCTEQVRQRDSRGLRARRIKYCSAACRLKHSGDLQRGMPYGTRREG